MFSFMSYFTDLSEIPWRRVLEKYTENILLL